MTNISFSSRIAAFHRRDWCARDNSGPRGWRATIRPSTFEREVSAILLGQSPDCVPACDVVIRVGRFRELKIAAVAKRNEEEAPPELRHAIVCSVEHRPNRAIVSAGALIYLVKARQ